MANYIKTIKAGNDNIYPRTKTSAVYNDSSVALDNILAGKQDSLVPGTTIKNINNQSILGSGNLLEVQTSISASSTHAQIPSAKCMYDLIGSLESLLEALL